MGESKQRNIGVETRMAALIINLLSITCHVGFGEHDGYVVSVEREVDLPLGNVNVGTDDVT